MGRDAGAILTTPLVDAALRVRKAVLAAAPTPDWGATVAMGADGTPTKHIDEVAERALFEELERTNWEIDVLSEEAGFVERGGSRLLVADPVDGTANAVRGIPFYCVSLALGRSRLSDIEEGVVVNIPTGEVYHARKGKGATRDGAPLRVRRWQPGRDTISIYLGPEAPPAAFELTHFPRRVRNFGAAALEFCLVASGGLDGYVQWGSALRVTDIAAGALILREAGGELFDLSGATLEMPLTISSRREVTATGSRELADEIARRTREAHKARTARDLGPEEASA